MSSRKPQLIRNFLREFGHQMGYDASSFPNKILLKVSQLRDQGVAIEEVVGIRKFGGRWYAVDLEQLKTWLSIHVKPGPKHGLKTIPENMNQEEFLVKAKGIYNLRAILGFLDTQVVSFYKVRNAAKKVEHRGGDIRKELGVFMKNDIWVVEFPQFGDFLREHEPDIWTQHQRLRAGNASQ